ncbi:MAG: hypothetical protein RLY31_1145 [Bacteroidota bacterium]|jgi:hypothetical protein
MVDDPVEFLTGKAAHGSHPIHRYDTEHQSQDYFKRIDNAMKKIAPNRLILYVLIAVSTGCYVYLQTSPYPAGRPYSAACLPSSTEGPRQQQETDDASGITLPDLQLIKKILNLTKMVNREY